MIDCDWYKLIKFLLSKLLIIISLILESGHYLGIILLRMSEIRPEFMHRKDSKDEWGEDFRLSPVEDKRHL